MATKILKGPNSNEYIKKCSNCGCVFSYTEDDVLNVETLRGYRNKKSFDCLDSVENVLNVLPEMIVDGAFISKYTINQLKKYKGWVCWMDYSANIIKCPCCKREQIKYTSIDSISVNPEGSNDESEIITIL